jgi:segregation and condensation protein A
VFEGPIDLLLQLITRQRVDIYEVSLATITEEYLQVLRGLEELDLEVATGFLVVAATLLELKSARLLPGRFGEERDAALLEERDLLLARLVECATYRAAGAYLADRLEAGAAYHPRSVPLEPRYAGLLPDVLEGVSVVDLAAAAARALQPKSQPELDLSHLAPPTASVRAAILAVCDQLRVVGRASFAELCPPGSSRSEVVVRFLALLELFKAGALELSQAERFGAIVATWRDDDAAAEALAEAEEYSAVSEAPAVRAGGAP